MSAFVRNRLIDEVYLPIIGDNLAKQMGTAGENKRTDLMGLLLLISPPGYGKTTLMEYIASRLGLVFVKVNGPALGHDVVALDPEQAPNAGAAEELLKLNLALEMGDNIMLYIDDIQHCNPEFLQKFISLCDAQRKIEGVYKGRSQTYDLRGRKVCVVMAGNPYTESGDKFRIPDMLANRADIYNLGDIIGDSAEAFKLSYIENSMTSNEVLGRLAAKSRKDALTLVGVAAGGDRDGLDFEANHSAEEMNEYVSLFQKVIAVRDVILKVNLGYIHSAGQADEYRVEPPFKLQGSYRDMNKIVQKLNPIMNDAELQTLILSHYTSESQTLTTGAESNLLKFKEMYNVRTEKEESRWNDIVTEFQRLQRINSSGGQQMGEILEQMTAISAGLSNIGSALNKNGDSQTGTNE
jgi:MoxR-like ATPase